MQEEDQILQPFENEVIDLVQYFFDANPKIVVVARQNPKLIGCITSFFKQRQYTVELVEYEFNTAIKLEKPYLQIASEVHASPIQHSQSRDQNLSVDIIQASSQTYQNQLVQQNYEERDGQVDEPIIKQQDIQEYIIQGGRAGGQEQAIQPQTITRSASKRPLESGNEEIRDLCKKEEVEYRPQHRYQLRAQNFVSFTKSNGQLNEQIARKKRRKMGLQKRKEAQKKKTRRESQEAESCREISFKGRKPEFPLMETMLVEQIKEACANRKRITQQSIRDRAKILVKEFRQYEGATFNASKGWVQKFLHRHPRILKLLNNYNRRRFNQEQVVNVREEDPEEINEEKNGDDENEVQKQ